MFKVAKSALAGSFFVLATSAHAAVDTAPITTGVTDASTAVSVIGAAVVLVVLGIKTYKWITRSL